MNLFKYVVIALLVGGAIGFIPTYLQLRDSRAQAVATETRLTMELAESRRHLALSSIHSQLGVLLLEVRESNFEAAGKTSTSLYNSIDDTLAIVEADDDLRRLRTLAATRDEVTAALALNDATVVGVLERLFGLLSASIV
jgi:hypothetical protein